MHCNYRNQFILINDKIISSNQSKLRLNDIIKTVQIFLATSLFVRIQKMNLLNGKYRFLLIVLVSIIGVQCRTKLRPRIFGGAAAQPGDFPYLASFRRSNWDGVIHQCGGAILTDKHILLAAHCYGKYNPISEYSIAVGALSRTDGETYKVKQFHAHEHYVPSAGMNDIAIVELEESIRFSDKVRPIELNADTIAGGIEGIVAGYGETNVNC